MKKEFEEQSLYFSSNSHESGGGNENWVQTVITCGRSVLRLPW